MSNLNETQFKDHIRVFRGVAGVTPETFSSEEAGIHWSTDKSVATRFANPDFRLNQGIDSDEGTVVEGRVHKDHVVQPGTEEHDHLASEHMIGEEYNSAHEKEVTIRRGAPIQAVKSTHVALDRSGVLYKKKAITHKTPKELKA